MVEGVLKQVEVVRGAVGEVPVRGVLCFVDAQWPLFGGDFVVRGVDVLWPKKLVQRLSATAGSIEVDEVAARLALRFRPA